MIDPIQERASQLLHEWQKYKGIHYSSKTEFPNAIDIELEKDAVARAIGNLQEGLMSRCSEKELEFHLNTIEHHLRLFKERITYELLRNG